MNPLASPGSRFIGETKTDIHLTNWRVDHGLQPRRQREMPIMPGYTFITAESSKLSPAQLLAPGGPPDGAWEYDLRLTAMLEFTVMEPSALNVLSAPMVRFYFYLKLLN